MIKKSLALVFLVLFTAAPLWAQTTSIGPSIEVKQMEFDFGSALEGQKVEHVYTITNKGAKELRILRVQPG